MKIVVNNVTAKLVDAPDKVHERLKWKLTTFAPGYKYTKLYKQKRWDGKVKLYDSGEFPTGLLPVAVNTITGFRYPNVSIEDNRFIKETFLENMTVPLRDYQMDAVKKAFQNSLYDTWWPRGVIQVATGGGKTEIAAAMIQAAPVPTVFLVHRTDLVNQSVERFKKYGIDVGVIGDGVFDISHVVTVCTIQSLMSFRHRTNKQTSSGERTDEEYQRILAKKREKAKVINKFLAGVEQVFVDEAHFIASDLDKGNMFTAALNSMPNAYMRWGLTATPFMREEYHNWLLSGSTGDLLYSISNRDLIDRGYLAEANVTMYTVPKLSGIPNSWPECYEVGIVMNRQRNYAIVDQIVQREGPILVLVKQVAHGKLLSKYAAEKGLTIPFVSGTSSTAEREKHLKALRSGKVKAIIGSAIWDEGVDIPEIKTLILAAGGKGKIKNLQRLGRGLRLAEGKSNVEVIDFFDHNTRWLKNHSKERKKLWEAQGFTVKECPLKTT